MWVDANTMNGVLEQRNGIFSVKAILIRTIVLHVILAVIIIFTLVTDFQAYSTYMHARTPLTLATQMYHA